MGKDALKIAGAVIGGILILAVIMFSTGYLGVGYKQTVGVAKAEADREVYEATPAYVNGMLQDLQKLKTEYEENKGTAAGKAILDTVRQRFAEFPAEKVPDYLQSWYLEVMQGTLKE